MLNKLVDIFHKYIRRVYLVSLIIVALIWFTLIWFIWSYAERFFQLLGVPSVLTTVLKYTLIALIFVSSIILFHKYVKLERIFIPIIEFLDLPKGPPLRLVYLVSLIGGLIWFIWLKAESFFQWLGIPPDLSTYFKYALIALILVISIIFFALVLTLMFPLERRVRVLARSYSEDELIIFLKNEIKEWLTVISNLLQNQPSKAGRRYTHSQLEEMENEISNKGRYLESLVTEVSNSLQISKESVEDLIGIKIGVEKQIAKAIIDDYKKIQDARETLKNNRSLTQNVSDYFEDEILEKTNDIQTKKQLLNTQIKWIEQLENQHGNIKTLLKIIREESTGKAIVILAELLGTAKTSEQLKFLIQAANSRVGYKLGELLGFKLKLKSPYLFNWDEIPGNAENKLKEFLKQSFGVNWVIAAKIEKTTDRRTINISDKNSLSLELNDEKSGVILTIDDVRTDEFIVKTERGVLKVYKSYLETELTWYEKPNPNLSKIEEFLKKFERLRKKSLKEELIKKFSEYEKIDYTQPISIALSFGYSAVLASILRNIIDEAQEAGQANELCIMIIKSEGFKNLTKAGKILPSGEELLRDELISRYPDIKDRCNIFPIETIKEKDMEGQINKIFIGIESINKLGNVVHPRGGTNIIRYLKEKNPNVKVFAFGETYKVQDFDDFHIDYTKLSMLEGNKFIDYIVTDHEVHKLTGGEWNLDCCMKHWIDKIRTRGLFV